MGAHLYLKKDNNDLVSHCKCDDALVTSPPQLDCPWCGCGWLFACIKCRKAFAFARAVNVEESWEDLGRRDLRGRFEHEPAADDVQEWVDFMTEYHSKIELGQQYVSFDGQVISTAESSLRFDGWYASHDLEFVPQVAALRDPSVVNTVLSNPDYWESHSLAECSLGEPAVRDQKKWWQFWK